MKINQSLLIGGTLLATGLYKTLKDYDEAPINRKNRTLIRDSVIIGLSAFTILKTDKFLSKQLNNKKIEKFALRASSKILKSNFVKKYLPEKFAQIQKTVPLFANILTDCTKGTLINLSGLLGGILAGIVTDKILSKIKIKEKEEPPKLLQYIPHNKYVSSPEFITRTQQIVNTSARIFETAGFIHNPFDKQGLLLNSMEASQEKNVKKVIEQSYSGIITEALIPTTFISIACAISQNLNRWVKIPIITVALIGGEYIGKFIGKHLHHEVKQH